jgi:acetyl esterase/lipase
MDTAVLFAARSYRKVFSLLFGLLCIVAITSSAQPSATETNALGSSSIPIPPLPKPLPGGLQYIHDVVIGTGGGRPLHVEMVVPKVPPSNPMPAVIWIHGGGLKGGSYKGNPIRKTLI